MPETVDVIVVSASHHEDVAADAADLHVTVRGSSLVTGSAALKKAAEIRKLVEDLAAAGVGEDDVKLGGVSAEVSSGLLGRSSTAQYRLRVRVRDLERLPDVLGAVTGAKNVTLGEVVWRFPESTERQAESLRLCVAQTNQKADAAAAALGVRIVGVHHLSEERLDEGPMPHVYASGAPMAMRARAAQQPVDLGFELGQTRREGLRVTVHYRVEGFSR